MLKAIRKCVVAAIIASVTGGVVHAADQQDAKGKHHYLPATLDTETSPISRIFMLDLKST